MLIFNLFISLTSFFVNSQPLLYSINTLPRLFYYPCTSFTLLIHSLNFLFCASFALSTHSLVILFTCLSFALSTSSIFILCILIVFTLSIHPSLFYSSLSFFLLTLTLTLTLTQSLVFLFTPVSLQTHSLVILFTSISFTSTNSLPRYFFTPVSFILSNRSLVILCIPVFFEKVPLLI